MTMELATKAQDNVLVKDHVSLTEEQRLLLDVPNQLTEAIIDKYRLAGQITQDGLVYVESLLLNNTANHSIGEICRLGSELLQKRIDGVFKKSIQEKGIAIPVRLEKNEFVSGVSPEDGDKFQGGYLNPGDIVKIVLGVHIDGYTAQGSHSVGIQGSDGGTILEEAKTDALYAAHVATEQVIGLLGSAVSSDSSIAGHVNGTRIRDVVDEVAKAFQVQVVPGSRVRRIRRFLAGQHQVVQEEDFKGVAWHTLADENEPINSAVFGKEEELSVLQGEAWLVDIQMSANSGRQGVVTVQDFKDPNGITIPPSIFSRDYTVQYELKLGSSRTLLSKVAALTSVYPFKLSQVSSSSSELRVSKLGLRENVAHHILVPQQVRRAEFVCSSEVGSTMNRSHKEVKAATSPVSVAREMATIVLVPSSISPTGSGEVLRLTGGIGEFPSSVKTQSQVQSLERKFESHIRSGIKVKVAQPSKKQELKC